MATWPYSALTVVLLCTLSGGPDRDEPPRLMSLATNGQAADGRSGAHGLDLDGSGSHLVFASDAGDLVASDDNRRLDVFVMSTDDRRIQRLSQRPDGSDANGISRDPRLSADGRFVAYTTHATNLLPGKTTEVGDIALADLDDGTTTRITIAPDGSEANGSSSLPDLCESGRFIVYQSWADNLVAGDTNAACDIFLFDRTTGVTTRVSVPPSGGEADGNSSYPALSGDGRFLSFSSEATNLVPDDTNGVTDQFVLDLESGGFERVNLGPDGEQADASGCLFPESALSQDGRFVVFLSLAGNLVESPAPPLVEQVYLRDRKLGTTRRISASTTDEAADDRCFGPTISADGRLVGFQTLARNLLAADQDTVMDAYVADARTHSVRRVSAARHEQGQRADCGRLVISPAGCATAFASSASDIAEGDDNDASDVFLLSL